MEVVGGGNLFSLICSHGPFEPSYARCYVGELTLALAHLHSLDFMHRDVKACVREPSIRSRLSTPLVPSADNVR